jgi:hypothetical protein
MLGFPFGEDMPWSEEVEPIQYTLPVFQMEFKVTAKLFLFQFWCVSGFCIVYCLLCLGDVHEKLMDEIAANMGDSTFENSGDSNEAAGKSESDRFDASTEGEIVVAPAAAIDEPLQPWGGKWSLNSPPIQPDDPQYTAVQTVVHAYEELKNFDAESIMYTTLIFDGSPLFPHTNEMSAAQSAPNYSLKRTSIFSFLRDNGLLSNELTYQVLTVTFRENNIAKDFDRFYKEWKRRSKHSVDTQSFAYEEEIYDMLGEALLMLERIPEGQEMLVSPRDEKEKEKEEAQVVMRESMLKKVGLDKE